MDVQKKIAEVLPLTKETKEFVLGRGAHARLAETVAKMFPGETAVLIIADEITMKIAEDTILPSFEGTPYSVSKFLMVRTAEKVDWDYINEIESAIRSAAAVPVMVGSGFLNDLTKLAAFRAGRKYICCATVGSVDGYSSNGAAIKTNGDKKTIYCDAPYVIVGDSDVLAAAPAFLTAAGYGDLAAKIPAGGDWIIADVFKTEPIQESIWNCFYDILPELLGDPKGIAAREPAAVENIFAGLTLSGFAMQAMRDTRPASAAEHLFSHIMQMTHHTHNGRPVLHGFEVSIGTLTMCAYYDEILKIDFSKIDVDKCVAAWPTLEQEQARANKVFEGFPVPGLGYEMTTGNDSHRGKWDTPEVVREQLTAVKENWPAIRARLEEQVWSFAKMKENFETVGAPTDPSQIGISRAYLKEMVAKVQLFRWRINGLDLLYRTGLLDEVTERIFGPGGAWDLRLERM